MTRLSKPPLRVVTCLESILTSMCVLFTTISFWNPDRVTTKQACPFCCRTYPPGAAFRDHIKYCQVRGPPHPQSTSNSPLGWRAGVESTTASYLI